MCKFTRNCRLGFAFNLSERDKRVLPPSLVRLARSEPAHSALSPQSSALSTQHSALSSPREVPVPFCHGLLALVLLSAAIGTAGCSSARSTPVITRAGTADWSQIRLPNIPPGDAYDAGVYAMRQWFRLAVTDPVEHVIQSVPSEYEQKGGTGRIRDTTIGFRNRMRRTGMLVVQDLDGGCIVKCKVATQRLDTADHRVFQSNQQFADVPNQTPIQGEASVSPSQNQVWTDMPRDRGLEQEILGIVKNRLTGNEAVTPGTSTEPAGKMGE